MVSLAVGHSAGSSKGRVSEGGVEGLLVGRHYPIQAQSTPFANRVQLSTDGLVSYINAVEDAFGGEVDFGQVVKFYDAEPIGPAAIHRQRCPGRKRRLSREALMNATSAPAWLSARTSPCGCRCAA